MITDMSGLVNESVTDPFIYQSLEEVVLASLLSIRDAEVRRKFSSNILVIGGGAHMCKIAEEIVIKLNARLEGVLGEQEDEDENILDKRLFTRKEQSQEWGIRYLKEKVPFIW
ncbi:unnamed protein product [Sphagnum balticum]